MPRTVPPPVQTTHARTMILKRGAMATAAAIVANLAIRTAGVEIFDIDPAEFAPFEIARPILLTALAGVGATAVYWAMSARAKDPAASFRLVAGALLLASLVPNAAMIVKPEAFPIPVDSTQGALLLMLMHVVAAGFLVGLLTRRTHHACCAPEVG